MMRASWQLLSSGVSWNGHECKVGRGWKANIEHRTSCIERRRRQPPSGWRSLKGSELESTNRGVAEVAEVNAERVRVTHDQWLEFLG